MDMRTNVKNYDRIFEPPPSPMLFEPPKSHFNSYQGHLQSIRSNYDRYQEYISNTNDRFKYSQPSSNNAEMWDLHTVRPESPLLQSTVSRQLVYMMKNSSNLINTIVVHIYLSAKEKHVDTMANSGMIKGVFGIGTSHGYGFLINSIGPGTHTNPTVITKDFDRDRWEFIDEIKAKDMIEEGPANIVEVKATVLTPNRRIEKTINKAINSELERAIPVVINRMQGSTLNMDNELRKELEQALVDEIAKNLGDTIDQMGSNLSDEDLGKLIEEGFNEIDKEFTTIQSKQNTIHLIHTTTTPTTTHVFRTTSSPTTTKRTTTIAMDEMIEESPFEKISTPYRPQRPHVSANPPSQPPHFTKSTTRGTSRSMEKTTRPVTKPAETTTRPGSYKATMASRRVINTTYATATTKIINRANWMTQKTTQRVTSTDGLSVVGSQSTAGAPSMRPPNSIKSSTTVRTYTRVTTPVTSVTYSTLPTTQKRLYETTTDMPHTTIRSTTSRAITQTPLNNKPTAKIGLLPGVYRNFTVRPLSQIITTQSSSTKQNIVDQKPSDVKEDSTRLLGSIQPTETLKEELEPKIVTSRPIHIISLDDDDDTTSTRKGIGLHVTAPSSQTSTMSLPHITAEVKEFGFSQPTITAITSTITSSSDQRSTVTSPSDFDNFSKQQNQAVTITTSDADYLNQGEIINSFPASMFPTLPEESEEELVDRNDHMVMKMRPVNFGDQNIMRANIMPEVLQTDSSKESNEMDSTSILPATNTVQQSTGTTFKILDNEETQQQKSTSMSVTKSSSTTPFQPHTITTQHTSFDEININTSNSPPFQAVPGVFEDQLSTSKQQESSTTSGRAEEMSTLNSPTGEIFPHPYTFITPKEPCPTPNDKSDRNRTDVLFLLDSSSSYNEHKFMSSLQLIQDTVSYFQNIGPDGTQVSLVQYNTEPYLEFSLRKHNCKQWLINDIADTEYMQGGNMSNKAVEKVSRFAFTKNRGDRPEAENVLVIITDGQSEDRVQEPVEIAKKNSLTVLVIATLEVDPHHLMELTGNMDNIFQFTTHPNKSLPRKLAERINSVAAGTQSHIQ
ncbi:von Willebrand factor type A domain protein [Dictyocaulus viviparus]|uniref:von Willebrand factor type A domain protein n=1 Tax=Dictyocaulus viviparus TaxID=29172 RepID=A0A0D8Y8S2_DICVI|nr:von Willebrand factor type A domain protein [Dictyocaulus viviparus]